MRRLVASLCVLVCALQVAGGPTLAFGVANLIAGIVVGELDVRKEARLVRSESGAVLRLDVVDLTEKRSIVNAVNLRLDAGYAFAGATAVVASQLSIAHDQRWLGAGVAMITQGVFAAIIDVIGTTNTRRVVHALGR